MVLDNSLETPIVIITHPSSITNSPMAAAKESPAPTAPPAKSITIIAIKIGNLPLQGMMLFVNIAINRSCGLSIMRQPVTPQALHPIPIAIVRLCLPCALHFEKKQSRLNAIRGR